MKNIVRVIGENGVVYEERMTTGQLTLFLHLADTETKAPLGVAFDEWMIQIEEALEGSSQQQEAAHQQG
jgi:hypothetical protein